MGHPCRDLPTPGKISSWPNSMNPPALHPGMLLGGTELLPPHCGSRQGDPGARFWEAEL
jgi:hypothetical protein